MKNYKNRIQQFVTISSQYLESLNRIYKIKTRRHQNIITITNNIFFCCYFYKREPSFDLIKEFFIFFFHLIYRFPLTSDFLVYIQFCFFRANIFNEWIYAWFSFHLWWIQFLIIVLIWLIKKYFRNGKWDFWLIVLNWRRDSHIRNNKKNVCQNICWIYRLVKSCRFFEMLICINRLVAKITSVWPKTVSEQCTCQKSLYKSERNYAGWWTYLRNRETERVREV